MGCGLETTKPVGDSWVLSMFAGLKCRLFTTQPAAACALCADIPHATTKAKGTRMSSSVPTLWEASGGLEVFHSALAAELKKTTAEVV